MDSLKEIEGKIIACERCSLCKTPGKKVPGEGNPNADVVFVGEAPGATEADTGRPFVGRAGKLLDNMIKSMDMERSNVFILNTVKCRPPNNRKPTPSELSLCKDYLEWQLKCIKPKVIVALGNSALGSLTGVDGGITKRNSVFEEYNGIKLMPCFHPSALLRNPNWKSSAWKALQKVKNEGLK